MAPSERDCGVGRMVQNFDRQLRLVLDGLITYSHFARATRREFERMAMYLTRRWAPPAWYLLDDVVQELLVAAWMAIWEWSPTRGPTLARYVVFNAMSGAKRALHKARGAKLSGSSDKNPSRFERPLSSFGIDGEGDALAEAMLAEDAVAEQRMIDHEEETENRDRALTVALAACRSEVERRVIQAIAATGDLEGGGESFYGSVDNRIKLRLVSEEHATKFVTRTARAVLSREALAAS
jgi:DNA-directed RNA polymerase specialized sigma24 family protein